MGPGWELAGERFSHHFLPGLVYGGGIEGGDREDETVPTIDRSGEPDRTLSVSRKDCSAAKIESELDSIWSDLAKHPKYAGAVRGVERSDVLVVSERGAGLTPELLAIAVFFAPALNAIAEQVGVDIWTHFILPELQRRFASVNEQGAGSKSG